MRREGGGGRIDLESEEHSDEGVDDVDCRDEDRGERDRDLGRSERFARRQLCRSAPASHRATVS